MRNVKRMKKRMTKLLSMFLAASMCVTSLETFSLMKPQTVEAAQEEGEPYLISSKKNMTISSANNGDLKGDAAKLNDGDTTSRWESSWTEATAWAQMDLGVVSDITSIDLVWEGACATKYKVLLSVDGTNWEEKKSVTDGAEGTITLDVTGQARYVRLECEEKKLPAYGYSLFEIQVYGYNGMYMVNLAQDKPATGFSMLDVWWMYDTDGNIRPGESSEAKNAVDGNIATKWRSDEDAKKFQEGTGQWLMVDLQKSYTIGEVDITWDGAAAATIYDIQISADGNDWTTIYRQMDGDNKEQNVLLYGTGRYVRLLCRTKYRESYVAVKELTVFKYMEGDEKAEHTIADFPQKNVVSVTGESGEGKGTYDTDDIYFANQARKPSYLAKDLSMPVASNDWWQSLLINEVGNALSVLPLKAQITAKNGLGILTMGQSWWKPAADYSQGAVTSTASESQMDFFVAPVDFATEGVYNEVAGYSDYHVTANTYDKNGLAMTTTHVKGSPYTFAEFGTHHDIAIKTNENADKSHTIKEFFNESGAILAKEGDTLTTDHIGISILDDDNEDKTMTSSSYYCITVPEGTVFTRTAEGVTMKMAGDSYLSAATMTDKTQLAMFYQHGYAFVTDTTATFDFDEDTSVITSYYTLTTKLMRQGFSDQSYQCLLPHQWDKYSEAANGGQKLDKVTYPSPRGDMRLFEGNQFCMQDTFYSMVPQFTSPENGEYDEEEVLYYLSTLESGTRGNLIGSDAYWQGKSLHPLGLGVLVADQIGNTEYKEIFLSRIKTILSDWFTYSGTEDQAFFFYDKNWGTLYYKDSEFGANKDISDHHFTYGYFLFASAVLATYDDEFYRDYHDMVDLLARDFGSPDEDDEMFCKLRSFDPYEGHSWAGGYADNDSGNNQEAASESLFGWVGMYLWSIASENAKMRDTAIYGFTTEINAIKHYWFDYYDQEEGYDASGWPADWPSASIGQVYGSIYFYGTFFGGYPIYVYGIHWLPDAEYISYYGMEQEQAASLYNGLLKDTQGQSEAHPDVDNYPGVDNTWQHIALPFLSLTNPDKALADIDRKTQSGNEGFNTYWFINNMKDLGSKTKDIYATGGVSASVYEKMVDGDKTYTAMVWNPTNHSIDVKFRNAQGIVGTATIGAKSLLRLDPTQKDAIQAETPEFSVESGTYEDTQYVKISSKTEGADIHYTTDGKTPTEESPVYSGRIAVSDTTTIKAIAVKDGYIKSSMQSVKITIASDAITTGKNLAKGKNVTVSSTEGANVGNNMTDQDAKTRWSSLVTDDAWCYVDLGETYTINKVKMSWETSYASKYQIQVSEDANTWTTVYSQDAGKGGIEEVVIDPVKARYVKMQGVARATAYGYSIYELGVYEARKAAKPQFSLEAGTYTGNQLLMMASATRGVEIHYTTDGTTPTKESSLYIPGITLYQDTQIQAIAIKKGMLVSDVASAAYQITGGNKPQDGDTYDENNAFTVEKEEVPKEEGLAGEEPGGSEEPEGGDEPGGDISLTKDNFAYHKMVTVTSSENENTSANITDGNLDTSWSSNYIDVEDRHQESCYIDLGEAVSFNQVQIYWQLNTPDNQYEIQVSDDAKEWRTVYVYRKATGKDNHDISNFDTTTARYVKMQGIAIGTAWGYNIREMLVGLSEQPQPFGANVASDAVVSASAADENYPAINAADSKADTSWKVSTVADTSITFDLCKQYQIDKVTLNWQEAYAAGYQIQTSADGEKWTTVAEVSAVKEQETTTFAATDARYVKLVLNNSNAVCELKEAEIYTVDSATEVEETYTGYTAQAAAASSEENPASVAGNVIDGDENTRWSSATTDDEWCYIDLGESKSVNRVQILWEEAYAVQYTIEVSDNATDWKTVYTQNEGTGGLEKITFAEEKARYIRMSGVKRQTVYGYSIYEISAGYVAPIPVDHVLLNQNSVTMKKDGTLQLIWTIYPANAGNTKVTFTSSDEAVATVSAEGLVTAHGTGEATIQVITEDGGKTAELQVVVPGKLTAPQLQAQLIGTNDVKLTWDEVKKAVSYDIYQSATVAGTYNKVNETAVTGTSYDITGLKRGTYYYKVVAVADAADSTYTDSDMSKASQVIKITQSLVSLSLDKTTATLQAGAELMVNAHVSPEETVVTWRSADTTIATVENGKITGIKPGRVNIYAVVEDEDVEAQISIVVQAKLPTVTATASVEDKNVTISWPMVSNAAGYMVYRGTDQLGDYEKIADVFANTLTYTDENLGDGTYYYKVVAKGDQELYFDSEFSEATDKITVTTEKPDQDKPGSDSGNTVPTSYTITYVLNKGTNVSANPVKYYNQTIQLKAAKRKGYAFAGWYLDSAYKTRIESITTKNTGNLSLYAKWTKVKTSKTAVKTLKSLKKKQMTVKLKKVSKVSGYEITYATNSKFTKGKKVVRTKGTTKTIKKLKSGKTYYVKVRAYKMDSTKKRVYSKYAKVKKVKIK